MDFVGWGSGEDLEGDGEAETKPKSAYIVQKYIYFSIRNVLTFNTYPL